MENVFVTGVYRSGKTRFAKQYAEKHNLVYINFDGIYDYSNPDNQSKKILRELPNSFIMDAIPIDENESWKDFSEYEVENPIKVICVYCPDKGVWLQRIKDSEMDRLLGDRRGLKRLRKLILALIRAKENKILQQSLGNRRGIRRWVRRWLYKIRYAERVISDVDEDMHLRKYRNFFLSNISSLRQFRNANYYDTIKNAYTSEDEMLDRIGYKYFPFENHMDGLGEGYDKGYQDIEIINLVGYSQSFKTWQNIKDLLDWRGKYVVDLGCFHGYFSFKVEDNGGIVLGLDKSSSVLNTARMINDLRGGNVEFKEWIGGEDVPEAEITLCLNSLHHFQDQDKALSKMKAKTAIFEINHNQKPLIEKYFQIIREEKSHRKNRTILLCKRIS